MFTGKQDFNPDTHTQEHTKNTNTCQSLMLPRNRLQAEGSRKKIKQEMIKEAAPKHKP